MMTRYAEFFIFGASCLDFFTLPCHLFAGQALQKKHAEFGYECNASDKIFDRHGAVGQLPAVGIRLPWGTGKPPPAQTGSTAMGKWDHCQRQIIRPPMGDSHHRQRG